MRKEIKALDNWLSSVNLPQENDRKIENKTLLEENKMLLKALIECQYQLQTWVESDAWSTQDEKAYTLAERAIKKAAKRTGTSTERRNEDAQRTGR